MVLHLRPSSRLTTAPSLDKEEQEKRGPYRQENNRQIFHVPFSDPSSLFGPIERCTIQSVIIEVGNLQLTIEINMVDNHSI